MADLTIRDIFDLPPAIPRCIVKIQDFDNEQTLQENIRDYVMTDRVAAKMARLVDRIVISCERRRRARATTCIAPLAPASGTPWRSWA